MSTFTRAAALFAASVAIVGCGDDDAPSRPDAGTDPFDVEALAGTWRVTDYVLFDEDVLVTARTLDVDSEGATILHENPTGFRWFERDVLAIDGDAVSFRGLLAEVSIEDDVLTFETAEVFAQLERSVGPTTEEWIEPIVTLDSTPTPLDSHVDLAWDSERVWTGNAFAQPFRSYTRETLDEFGSLASSLDGRALAFRAGSMLASNGNAESLALVNREDGTPMDHSGFIGSQIRGVTNTSSFMWITIDGDSDALKVYDPNEDVVGPPIEIAGNGELRGLTTSQSDVYAIYNGYLTRFDVTGTGVERELHRVATYGHDNLELGGVVNAGGQFFVHGYNAELDRFELHKVEF